MLGTFDEPEHVRVLGRHHEEGRAEQRVRPRREHRVVDGVGGIDILAAERDLGTGAPPDPIALHRLDVLRPRDRVKVVEEPVGVVGDPEEPLLELAQLDHVSAALTAAIDDLLVGEHGLVVGAPLHRRLLAVREITLEQLEEDPLRPAVVPRLAGGELPRPVDRDPPRAERPLERGDRRLGRLQRVDAGIDRVVLGGQAERVVAHRVQHALTDAAAEVRDRVPEGVVLQVTDVRLAARVREHLEHVGLLRRAAGLVRHLPGVLARPQLLPLGLNLIWFVATVSHFYNGAYFRYAFRLRVVIGGRGRFAIRFQGVAGGELAQNRTIALYHQGVAENGPSSSKSAPSASSGSPASSTTAADRVASIVAAAEAAAERMRREAEERMTCRIAEGDRAADNRVKAAEDEAEEIVQLAQSEATRLRESARTESKQQKTAAATEALAVVGRAQEEADKTLAEAKAAAAKTKEDAEQQSRDLLREARTTATDVRTEGLEIVSNLREMGDSLRSNAERLLRDVQLVYSRMVAQIDRTDGGLPPGARSGTPINARRGAGGRTSTRPSARDRPGDRPDDLDVPEFIPPG